MKWKNSPPKKNLQVIRVLFVGLMIVGVGSGLLYINMINSVPEKPSKTSTREIKSAADAPIILNGDAALDAFCSGNGTDGLSWANAHVIDGYQISTSGAYGLLLNETTRYVIIQNFQVTGGVTYAVAFLNGSNIKIQDVHTNEGSYSLYIDNCENVSISRGDFENTGYGISMEESQNISISNCRFAFDGSGRVMTLPLSVLNSRNITVDLCNFDDLFKPLSKTPYCSVINSIDFAMLNSTMQSSRATNVAPAFLQISGGSQSEVINNSVSNTEQWGLRLLDHSDFTVLRNDFDVIDDEPFYLSNCSNGYIAHNNFTSEGILLDENSLFENLTIDSTNLVNGRPVHYYENVSLLDESLGDIGQLILNKVNNSQFSDFQIIDSGRAIQIYGCEDITLDRLNITDYQRYGVYSYTSNHLNCINLTVNGNGYGIYSNTIQTLGIADCDINASNYAIYARTAQDIAIDHNEIRSTSGGVLIRTADNVSLTHNAFFDCSYDYSSYDVTNFVLDDTNTRNGIPMFYRTDLADQTYNIGQKSEFQLVNCRNLVINNLELIPGSEGIQLTNCSNIQFANFTIAEAAYGFIMSDCENVSLINGTFSNCETGGELDNCNNTLIQRTFFNVTGDYILNLYDCNTANFTENGFLNFSYGIYLGDCSDISIVDNVYGNNDSDFLEIDSALNLVVEENVESDAYDRDSFGPLYIDPNPFGGSDITDNSDDTATDDTTDDDGSTDDTTGGDDSGDGNPLPPWAVVIIVIGTASLIVAGIFFVAYKRKEGSPSIQG